MTQKLILLVEDDPKRAAEIQACIPGSLHCVWARSAGAAYGVLRRDKFAGIMLDFDLYRSAHGDPQFTGETVAQAICETQQTQDCAILVHSQNPAGGRHVTEMLTDAGFSVEHHPWCDEAKAAIQDGTRDILESD